MDIKKFIESIDSSDLLYLAWIESNLTPSQMEDAWGIIKSVLMDAAFVKDLPDSKGSIPLTDVLDRPEHVALQYQEPLGSLVKNNPYVCSFCGQDTSQVEYDYLSGYDHLACVLKESLNSKSLEKVSETSQVEISPSPEEKLLHAIKSSQTKVKKDKTEKIVENSNKGDKTFLELLARGEYLPPKD